MIEPIVMGDSLSQVNSSLDISKGYNQSYGFYDLVVDSVKSVNDDVNVSQSLSRKYAAGESVDIQDAMLSMEQANLSLQLISQVRNKIIDATHEILRMQI